MGGELTPAREGFDFLAGADPYSDGVVARPGHEIVHVVVGNRPPWQEGFGVIERFLERRGRPIEAVCGIELRSPRPVGFDGFADLKLATLVDSNPVSIQLGWENEFTEQVILNRF